MLIQFKSNPWNLENPINYWPSTFEHPFSPNKRPSYIAAPEYREKCILESRTCWRIQAQSYLNKENITSNTSTYFKCSGLMKGAYFLFCLLGVFLKSFKFCSYSSIFIRIEHLYFPLHFPVKGLSDLLGLLCQRLCHSWRISIFLPSTPSCATSDPCIYNGINLLHKLASIRRKESGVL